jgi:uncharacterized phiE125 gp8 family phage protein
MNLRVITPPAAEPVSLEAMKAHLRVDGTTDDVLISSYLLSARELGEGLARRAFLTQTLELTINAWPIANCPYKLPRPPLQSIVSVKYKNQTGVEATWTDYVADTASEPGTVIFRSTPGVALLESGAITIRFVAGYADSSAFLPNSLVQGILQLVAHWYENRESQDVPGNIRKLFIGERVVWF